MAHKLKLCVSLLHAGMLLNTFPQHTVERLFLWPGNKTRAVEHPPVHGVMSSDPSKPLSCPWRADRGCFSVVSSDVHLFSPGSQLGASAQCYTSALLHPQLPFGAALAVALVGHFFWIPILALPLGFVTKDFTVHGADLVTREAAWLCLPGAWVVNQ